MFFRSSTRLVGHRRFSSARRLHICDLEVPHVGRRLRVEAAEEADRERLVDFLCRVAAEREPVCRSVGVSAPEIRPFVERIVQRGLSDRFSLLAIDREDGELVAVSTACRLSVRRDRVAAARVLPDYKEVIDGLAEWLPSRNARRVVGPALDCVDILANFLPTDCRQVLRLDMSAVRGDCVGGNIVRRLLFEQVKMGAAEGIEWGHGQTTARATQHVAEQMGFRPVFFKQYSKLFDGGQPIHRRLPLLGGSTQMTLFVGRLDEILHHYDDH